MFKKMFSGGSHFAKQVVEYSRLDHVQRITIIAIRLFLVAAILWMITHNNAGPAMLVIILLINTYIPHFLFERAYKVALPVEFHFAIIIFLFSSIFVGTVLELYWYWPWWDKFVHALSGVIFGFLGYFILYTLYEQQKLKMSLKLIAMFVFCFSLASGAVWEIAEFVSDKLWDSGAQRNGNDDTMLDLIWDAVGALVVTVAGYRYLKNGRGYMHRFVKNFKQHNPQLFPKQ